MQIEKSKAKPYDRLNQKFETCSLCGQNQAQGDQCLRHTGTKRILCISCLLKIADIN